MEFGYDPLKNLSNKDKRGIDFEEAQILWDDEDRIQFSAKSNTEPRQAILAKKEDKIGAAFFTKRDEVTRIISVRRAKENEERTYYES